MNLKLMAMRKVLFAILMVLCLASCKDSPISGYVVGKSFIPAHNTTRYDVILKKPMVNSVPDQWIVWVADSCRVRSVHVEKSTFDTLKHGQFVNSKGFYYGKKTND